MVSVVKSAIAKKLDKLLFSAFAHGYCKGAMAVKAGNVDFEKRGNVLVLRDKDVLKDTSEKRS